MIKHDKAAGHQWRKLAEISLCLQASGWRRISWLKTAQQAAVALRRGGWRLGAGYLKAADSIKIENALARQIWRRENCNSGMASRRQTRMAWLAISALVAGNIAAITSIWRGGGGSVGVGWQPRNGSAAAIFEEMRQLCCKKAIKRSGNRHRAKGNRSIVDVVA